MDYSIEVIQSEVEKELRDADIIVDDPVTLEIATDMVLEHDKLRKKIEEYWASPSKMAYDSWQAILKKKGEMLNPVNESREQLKNKINEYMTEVRKREAEEQRLVEEKRREEEKAEAERLLELSKQAKEEGNKELAKDLKHQSENVVIIPEVIEGALEKTTKTSAGSVTGKDDILVEIKDKRELLLQMIEDELFEIIEIKEAKLKAWLKLTGKDKYAGVAIQKIVSATFRGKK